MTDNPLDEIIDNMMLPFWRQLEIAAATMDVDAAYILAIELKAMAETKRQMQ